RSPVWPAEGAGDPRARRGTGTCTWTLTAPGAGKPPSPPHGPALWNFAVLGTAKFHDAASHGPRARTFAALHGAGPLPRWASAGAACWSDLLPADTAPSCVPAGSVPVPARAREEGAAGEQQPRWISSAILARSSSGGRRRAAATRRRGAPHRFDWARRFRPRLSPHRCLDPRHDHLDRHAVVAALRDDHVRVAHAGLHELEVHRPHGGDVLPDHGFDGAAALGHVPLEAADQPHIRVYEDADVHEPPELGL